MNSATASKTFHLPTIPLTLVDIVNRRAAATGSPRYAMLTGHADYNGHRIAVGFKPHAASGPTWNSEYYWGERVVLGRGSLETCLRAAKAEYDRGARGTTVVGRTDPNAPESIEEQEALFRKYGFQTGEEPKSEPTAQQLAVTDALLYEGTGLVRGLVHAALNFQGTTFAEWKAIRNDLTRNKR